VIFRQAKDEGGGESDGATRVARTGPIEQNGDGWESLWVR